MKQLFLGGISLGFHFYFFLAFGSLFRKILGRKEGLNRYSPLFTPVLGLFLYYGLFELLALPMTLLLVPLHVLTVVWGAALAAVGLAAAFLCGRDWVKSGKTLAEIFKKQPGIYLLAGVLVLGQMIYVAAYDLNSADAAYYVANISTSLYTDTLGRYNPYTGFLSSVFNIRYVTAAWYLDTAAFAKVFHVHPMVLAKTINPVMWTFLADLVYYQLGYALFRGKREETAEKLLSDSGRERGNGFFSVRKKAVAFLIAAVFFLLLAGNQEFSGFIFYRAYEGKAMLEGLVIPFLFLLFVRLYRDPEDKMAWWGLFFTALGAVCLTTSSMTVVPAAVFAGILPTALKQKKIRPLFRGVLAILPDVAVLALYLAVKLRIVTLAAK